MHCQLQVLTPLQILIPFPPQGPGAHRQTPNMSPYNSPNLVTNLSPNLVITKFVTKFGDKFVTKFVTKLHQVHTSWWVIISDIKLATQKETNSKQK